MCGFFLNHFTSWKETEGGVMSTESQLKNFFELLIKQHYVTTW